MIIHYTPSRALDLLLVQWWAVASATGDLDRLFSSADIMPSDALRTFGAPQHTLLAYDDEGIWWLMLCSPMMTGACVGLWIRPDKRHTKQALRATLTGYHYAFTQWPVLVGFTKQPELLSAHERVGYVVLGEIPLLYGGETAYVVYLTEQRFQEATWALNHRGKRLDRGDSSSRRVRPSDEAFSDGPDSPAMNSSDKSRLH